MLLSLIYLEHTIEKEEKLSYKYAKEIEKDSVNLIIYDFAMFFGNAYLRSSKYSIQY